MPSGAFAGSCSLRYFLYIPMLAETQCMNSASSEESRTACTPASAIHEACISSACTLQEQQPPGDGEEPEQKRPLPEPTNVDRLALFHELESFTARWSNAARATGDHELVLIAPLLWAAKLACWNECATKMTALHQAALNFVEEHVPDSERTDKAALHVVPPWVGWCPVYDEASVFLGLRQIGDAALGQRAQVADVPPHFTEAQIAALGQNLAYYLHEVLPQCPAHATPNEMGQCIAKLLEDGRTHSPEAIARVAWKAATVFSRLREFGAERLSRQASKAGFPISETGLPYGTTSDQLDEEAEVLARELNGCFGKALSQRIDELLKEETTADDVSERVRQRLRRRERQPANDQRIAARMQQVEMAGRFAAPMLGYLVSLVPKSLDPVELLGVSREFAAYLCRGLFPTDEQRVKRRIAEALRTRKPRTPEQTVRVALEAAGISSTFFDRITRASDGLPAFEAPPK